MESVWGNKKALPFLPGHKLRAAGRARLGMGEGD